MRTSWLLAPAAALLVAGCGGAAEPAAPPPSATTSSATAAPATFTSVSELSDAVNASTSKAKSARLVFNGGLNGPTEMRGTGAFAYAGERTAMTLGVDAPTSGATEVRLVDKTLYLKGDGEVEPGKPWVKFDVGSEHPLAEMTGSVVRVLESADPRRVLRELIGVGDLASALPAQIDGVQLTRYAIEADLQAYAVLNGASAEEAATLPRKTVVWAVFVDSDNLPRRLSIEPPETSQNMAIDYTDWGKAVVIAAPPAAEIAELPES